jgi:hypothetical protein
VRKRRPDLRATFAAGTTGEQRFDIRQLDMIRPAVGRDLDVMAAFVVAAIDQDIADAGGAPTGVNYKVLKMRTA